MILDIFILHVSTNYSIRAEKNIVMASLAAKTSVWNWCFQDTNSSHFKLIII